MNKLSPENYFINKNLSIYSYTYINRVNKNIPLFSLAQ